MGARVLVIDDDPVNADLIGYLLRAFGHDPILALGGEAALEEAAASVPDLVLCDIEMPGTDGFEVVRRLRADGRFASTRIVGVTALAMVGDREKVLNAGFDGYLTKPITPETFVGEIEKYLPTGMAGLAPPRQTRSDERLEPRPPATAPPQRRNGGYALVVDDTEPNLHLMRHLISAFGVEVRTATSADEALRIARATPPSLIISDIHMPGRSGIDLLQAARSDADLKHVPFLLISSTTASAEERRMAEECGADAFLLRPLDAETMMAELARWFPAEERT
jgi:two-component system cell cycle response regulator